MPEESQQLPEDARLELEERLSKFEAALRAPHTSSGKTAIIATWMNDCCLAKVLQRRGNHLNHFGHAQGGNTVLLPEEALFLMETDRMLLLHSDRSTRILSLQEAASLAHDAGVSSEEYLVYSHLRRAGFIARRYGLPWTDAGGNNGRRDGPSQKRRANFGVGERDPRPLRSAASDPRHRGWWSGELPSAERGEEGVERVRDLEPSFNVWAPNPGFSKKDPDRMLFRLVLCSDGPPSAREVRALREKAGTEVDLKFCSVANGIVMIFALRPWC